MNFRTTYLGLDLKSPFVVGASPFCDDVDMAYRLEEAGAAALVMRSLFEEQIGAPRRAATPVVVDDGIHVPEYAEYQLSPNEYLRQIERLKKRVTIPVIASLNGYHPGGWIEFSRKIEAAGADAIELNFYHVVTDSALAADQVEMEMLGLTCTVSGSVRIPVAVKLSPFHASVAQLAVALELSGAAGVVVFNRFYQPDIDPEDLRVYPTLRLSDTSDLLLRLRWLAILSPLLRGSLAVTGGVHTTAGVVKSILAGANAVQLVSVLLRDGPHVISTLGAGLDHWMRDHGYQEIEEFRGALNLSRCPDPAAFERANYIRMLQSWRA